MIGTLESVSDDLMDMKSKIQCAFIPEIQDVEAAAFARLAPRVFKKHEWRALAQDCVHEFE